MYLDDVWVWGETFTECRRNLKETITLLQYCGFVINNKKSQLTLVQEARVLGHVVNTIIMTISLPKEKEQEKLTYLKFLYSANTCTIQQLAKGIGMLISLLYVLPQGLAHY